MKLNLGCGKDYREGWINVDSCKAYKSDMQFDLNTKPYPFKDNTADLVLMNNVLEHIDSILCLEEVYRICKPNATVIIEVPYGSTGFNHIQHTKYFNWCTFKNLRKPYMPFQFELIKQYPVIKQSKGIGSLRRFIPFKHHLSYLFPILVQNIHAELQPIKQKIKEGK